MSRLPSASTLKSVYWSSGLGGGPSSTLPSGLNLASWQGQMNSLASACQLTVQPRCVQRLERMRMSLGSSDFRMTYPPKLVPVLSQPLTCVRVNEKGVGVLTGIAASFPMGIQASFEPARRAGSIRYPTTGAPMTTVISPPMAPVVTFIKSRRLMRLEPDMHASSGNGLQCFFDRSLG